MACMHGFSQQCKPIINSSIQPVLNSLTDKGIDHITIQNNAIVTLIEYLGVIALPGSAISKPN